MQISSQQAPIVIKVGGSFYNTIESPENALLATISTLQQQGRRVVIVHGGGEQVLERLQALGIKSERKNGLRVTPDEHMPIVTSVLAGELNKNLVAALAKHSVNAVGISLADGDLATCVEHPDNLGAVGVPTAKNASLLNALLQQNMVPIVASIGKDDNGRLYNVNADHAAICIAQLLNTRLYFFADVRGVLDQNKELISTLNADVSKQLIADNVITDGMVVKVQAAQFAARQINKPVTIASWDDSPALFLGDLVLGNNTQSCGTEILPDTHSYLP